MCSLLGPTDQLARWLRYQHVFTFDRSHQSAVAYCRSTVSYAIQSREQSEIELRSRLQSEDLLCSTFCGYHDRARRISRRHAREYGRINDE